MLVESGGPGLERTMTESRALGELAATPPSSRIVDAARAERIGLFNRVVADDQLHAEAFALARAMADGPAVALRHMKDNLDEAMHIDFDTALQHEARRLVDASQTEDHREAVRAFVEKRKPVFSGR